MSPDRRTTQGEVTRLLQAARGGDREAMDRLMPLVYDDLRALAHRQLRREYRERTMHPRSLVHEAYMKIDGGGGLNASDRAHFLAIAARAMRQILVDDARRRTSIKRGVGWERTTLTDHDWVAEFSPDEIIALNDAMEQLDPRQRQLVECRFFGGMEEQEIALLLGGPDGTVRRDWIKARAWLYRHVYGPTTD